MRVLLQLRDLPRQAEPLGFLDSGKDAANPGGGVKSAGGEQLRRAHAAVLPGDGESGAIGGDVHRGEVR